jgi:O-antigen/teichoic acid export membrane protein
MGSSLFAKGLPFLLLPYITRVLSPEQFGIASIFMLIVAVFVAFVSSNAQTALSRVFFKQNNKKYLSELIGSILTYNLILFTIVLTIVTLASLYFDAVLDIPSYIFLILPIIALFTSVYQLLLTLFRCMNKPKRFASYEISYSLVQVITIFSVFYFFSPSWYYQFWSVLIATLLLGVLALINLYRLYPFELQTSQLKPVTRLCLPQIMHLLGGLTLAVGDRLIIQQYLGSDAVGIYVAAYSFGMIITVLVDAYSRAYGPKIYQYLAEDNRQLGKNKANKLMIYSMVALIPVFLIYFVVSYFAYDLIIGTAYAEGKSLLALIILGVLFQSIYKMIFPFLIDLALTKELAAINVFGALLNIGLNIYFISVLGLLGSALATAICYGIVFLYCIYFKLRGNQLLGLDDIETS